MKRLILLFVLAPAALAQHEYIIPMIGTARGVDADHFAAASVLNPTARTAHIRVTAVYPVYPTQQCEIEAPAELAPRSRGSIRFRSDCPVSDLAALTIESDERLVVETSITSSLRRLVVLHDVQQVAAGTAWIPFAVEALAYGEFDDDTRRANLLLINPNAFGLRVRIELHRPEANASRVETLVVAPRSTILHPLAPVPVPPSFPTILTGHHEILVAADDRFWAGVSSLTTTGGNHFEEAVPLEP